MRWAPLAIVAAVAAPARAEVTRAPAIAKFVPAVYPPDERAAGREAKVVAQVDIGADGAVVAASVVESAGQAFDDAALAAIRQFEFTPAEIDGAPASVRILYAYEFKLDTVVEARRDGELAGVVRDRATGAPLAGVTVALDGGLAAVTDERGAFAFPSVPPGTRTLTLSSSAITAVQTRETVEAGRRLEVVYDVALAPAAGEPADADDLEIVVTAPVLERATAAVSVAAGVARRVPGTGGDVVKVVESMPGVARAAAGSGQLVVWGASPDDTRVYVDGVRIPRLYHTGGLRSVLAADLVRSIELVPGGWGAEHGRSLGGLVDIQLVPLGGDTAGVVAVDALDGAGAVRFAATDRVRVAAAARRSHLGWLIAQATDRDTGDLVPIPSYVDGQLRVGYEASRRTRFEAAAIGAFDRVDRSVASGDPAMTRSDRADAGFWRAWGSVHRDAADGAAVDVVVFGGADAATRREQFGGRPTELDVATNVYGARASWRRTSGRAAVAIGLDAEVFDAHLGRTGAVTVPAREGDLRVFGQPPPDQLAADAWRVVGASAAPYAQVDVALWGGRAHVVPGLRFEPFLVSASRRTPVAGATPSVGLFAESTTLQPRLAARVDVSPRVRVSAAAGRYHQAPQPEDLSAVFGNPALPIAAATHLVAGVAVRWSSLVSTEVTAFATRSDRLAVRSPSANPRLAQALEPIGTGAATGVQALVRRELAHGVFGWLSYTLSRATRTDAPGAAARLFDFDQTHVLTALVSWDLGRGVEVGVRARYATGAPRTPVVGSYFDNRTDRFQPRFGAHNSERLPAFAQLDARIAKRFRVQGGDAEVYLDLQNATDRDNAEEIVYSTDFRTRGAIRGLPILPVAGARWSW
ncbi:MAG: TonB-dependent receptor [Deltaproteobacteria bacterium]|nr:TonB-dependent receptor [Deltaproteobacteria bacterium]